MIVDLESVSIFIRPGATDMRKQSNGLILTYIIIHRKFLGCTPFSAVQRSPSLNNYPQCSV